MTQNDPQNTPSNDEVEPPSIEQQRAELSETVAALADKADVPSRVRNEATAQAHRAQSAAEDNPQVVIASIAGAVIAFVAVVIWRKKRASKRGGLR